MAFIISCFIFVFGLCIGSFLNAWIWRLSQEDRSITRGRSVCTDCSHELMPCDLVPLVSFMMLRGKCRYCQMPISWQYPIVELITGVLFVVAAWTVMARGGADPRLMDWMQIPRELIFLMLRDWYAIAILMVIFVYDIRWGYILDRVTLPAIGIVLVVNSFIADVSFTNLALAGILGGGFFLAQYLISKGKWIGGGDIRLGALMGVLLGFPNILVAMWLAYAIGAVVGIGLILAKKKHMSSEMPFGAFLAPATVAVLLFETQVADMITIYFRF